jgi:hypothetical protein
MWLCDNYKDLPNKSLYDFLDPSNNYQREHFQMFSNVVENSSSTIIHDWVIDLNNGMETFDFRMANHNYATHIFNLLIRDQ